MQKYTCVGCAFWQTTSTSNFSPRLALLPVLQRPAAVAAAKRVSHRMAPGFNLFSRIANYLAQEVIVKGLANNKAFQQFALRSAESLAEARNALQETAKRLSNSPTANELKNVSNKVRNFKTKKGVVISKCS